jgi:hypothetical protein
VSFSDGVLDASLHEGPEGLLVTLRGDLTEASDFASLLPRIPRGRVAFAFDMEGIHHMNSMGLKRWLDFLAALDPQASYGFRRCSFAFVLQVGLLPLAVGRGRIESFFAPMRCGKCDSESQALFETRALPDPPRLGAIACECGGRATLDEIPERFFAFLQ